MPQIEIVRPALIILDHTISANRRDSPLLGSAPDNQDTRSRPVQSAHDPYLLQGDSWEIGRDAACDLRVLGPRPDISRQHATIQREGARFVLCDHSRHGSYVNGHLIGAPWPLQPEDAIGLATPLELMRFIDLARAPEALPALTEREHEVLRLLSDGKADKEIAATLHITPATVNTHLKSIYEKLRARNRTEAVNQARRHRLL